MTREEFTNSLTRNGKSYEIEGDNIIVTGEGDITLFYTTSLVIPPNVIFKNDGGVYIYSANKIPSSTEFRNKGGVFFNKINSENWNSNIRGIKGIKLINIMIKKGLI